MKVGCHVSIAGNIWECFERAESVKCEVFQIFTQNQRQWKSVQYSEDDVNRFRELRTKGKYKNVPLIAHASYLINLCAEDPEKLEKSRSAFVEELKRCDILGIEYLVIHPGSHGSKGEEWGVNAVAETLNLCMEQYMPKVQILLETTAGQGSNLGYKFEHLRDIIGLVNRSDGMGVCIDTCHIWAAGYPLDDADSIETTLNEVREILGFNRVKVWHFNDSLKERGSKRDRHAPLGEGMIGLEAFSYLMNYDSFKEHPAILEIPGGTEKFAENIALLKSLRK
ncbi:MAG: deoxyribonuclease IV [Calditrichaeota bacterium]|nr:deoxyribonuclease IV [Calditrichota bacterium]